MIRQPVQSSNIDSVGYNANEQVLEIAFNSGGIYRYFNVPKKVYDNLLNSRSKGKFFHKNIKGQYRYFKVI